MSKIDDYLANPGGKLVFVLAAEDPNAKDPEFILIAYGPDIIAKMTFEEAYSVADFFYERLPPRNKAGLQ